MADKKVYVATVHYCIEGNSSVLFGCSGLIIYDVESKEEAQNDAISKVFKTLYEDDKIFSILGCKAGELSKERLTDLASKARTQEKIEDESAEQADVD